MSEGDRFHVILAEARKLLRMDESRQCAAMIAPAIAAAEASICAGTCHFASLCRLLDLAAQASFANGEKKLGMEYLQRATNILQTHLAKAETGDNRELYGLLAGLWQNLSFAALDNDDFDTAAGARDQALETARRVYGAADPAMAPLYFGISFIHYRMGQWDKAEELTRKAKDIWENPEHPNPEKAATCMNNLGRIYEERGDFATGIAWHKKAVAARRLLSNRSDLAFSLGNLGVALAQNGQWPAAAASLEEAVAVYRETGLEKSRECRGYAANLEICLKAMANGDML